MQRRIGLAQALINDPDLVILDEPTAGLDPIGCREVKDLIVALARRGKTVILSSHLLADVEDVCDRVVIYYGGKIQAAGTLKELLAEPDTLRITTPVLPRETLERVLEVIRQRRGDRQGARGQSDAKSRKLFSGRGGKGETRGARDQRRAIRRAGGGVFAGGRGRPSGGGENPGETVAAATGRATRRRIQTRRAGCRAENGREKTGGDGQSLRTVTGAGKTRACAGNEAGGFVEGG